MLRCGPEHVQMEAAAAVLSASSTELSPDALRSLLARSNRAPWYVVPIALVTILVAAIIAMVAFVVAIPVFIITFCVGIVGRAIARTRRGMAPA